MQICREYTIRFPFNGHMGISQKFGENPEYYKPSGFAGHFGIDFLTPWETPILACDDGTVSRIGWSDGNGYFIELKHSWGISLYCHFAHASGFALGTSVARGQVIGFAGNSGAVRSSLPATSAHRGTHLHFSIKINGIKNPQYKNWVDPLPHLE